MNVKIMNTIVTDNLDDVDFSNIRIGSQILLIEHQIDEPPENAVNNFKSLIVDEMDNNIISLQQAETKYEIDLNNEFINTEQSYDEFNILIIGNKPLKTNVRFSDDEKRYKDLFGNYKNNNPLFYKQIDEELEKFSYNFICPISKNMFFAFFCNNHIKNYDWTCSKKYFIFNKENKSYYELVSFDEIKLINLLERLDCNKNSSEFDKFKNAYKIINYDIEDYLSDKSILDEIKDFYSDVPFLSEYDITKFFLPVYKNKNFKGYIYSRYNWGTINTRYEYDYSNFNADELEINKRITKMIMRYLFKFYNAYINPYTGEIIDCDYEKIYEDPEHLIIKSKKNNIKHYFHKYNDIYVPAIKKEINEILELQETIDKLTS